MREATPHDVFIRAAQAVSEMPAYRTSYETGAAIDCVARAILAERERTEREVLTRIRDRLVEKRGDPLNYGQGFHDPLGPQIAVLDALLRV